MSEQDDLERYNEERAEAADWDERPVNALIAEGHTAHCAKRMIFGDGNCECGAAYAERMKAP